MYQITIKSKSRYDYWRTLANNLGLSSKAKERLEWIIFYHTVGKLSSRFTANYFGISEKTFWKWKARFNPNLIQSLEEKSRSPKTKRIWTVTKVEEKRIISLRESHIKYGKRKLKILYQDQYLQNISTWKIERVIRKHSLYPDPTEHKRKVKNLKRKGLKSKIRINKFKNIYPNTTIWHTDTVIIWWYGEKRAIFTAIEDQTKLAFARVYLTHSSRQATDFLRRLGYLTDGKLKVVHSDNGSEFGGEFEKACEELSILQIYSRVRTPKDNPALERFNWTIQDEWLGQSETGLDDITEANLDLTDWLIEYNFKRPHQSLDYKTPIQYALSEKSEVLPMSPASTKI